MYRPMTSTFRNTPQPTPNGEQSLYGTGHKDRKADAHINANSKTAVPQATVNGIVVSPATTRYLTSVAFIGDCLSMNLMALLMKIQRASLVTTTQQMIAQTPGCHSLRKQWVSRATCACPFPLNSCVLLAGGGLAPTVVTRCRRPKMWNCLSAIRAQKRGEGHSGRKLEAR